MQHRKLLAALLWLALPLSTSAQQAQLQGKHKLSIGTISALNGMVPLTYSQALGGKLALQVSAGPTFYSAYYNIQQSFYHDGSHSEVNPVSSHVLGEVYDYEDNYDIGENRKAGAGFMAGAGLNCNLGDYSLNGSYLGILAQFRRYNWQAKKVAELTPTITYPLTYLDTDPVREHGNLIDLALTYGASKLFASGFSVEFSAQLGLSYQRYHMQDFGAEFLLTGPQSATTFLVNGVQDFQVLRPYFNADLRFGGWW